MEKNKNKLLNTHILLSEAIAYYLKQKEKELTIKRGTESPYTIRDYAYHLDHFLNWCSKYHQTPINLLQIQEIDSNSIQEYILTLGKQKKAVATLAAHLYTIKSLFKLLARDSAGKITDQAKDIERQAQRYEKSPHLTLAHTQKFLAHIRALPIDEPARFRDKILFWTILKFGLRMSEALGLNREDLHFNEQMLTLSIRGKGNKGRALPLPTQAEFQSANGLVFEKILPNIDYIEHLTLYLKSPTGLRYYEVAKGIDTNISSTTKKPMPQVGQGKTKISKINPLFLSSRGNRLSHDMVRLSLDRIFIEVGLSGYNYTPHSLRHTAVTNWLYSGVDLQTVSELAGHASISTTERIYAHTEAKKLSQGLAQSI